MMKLSYDLHIHSCLSPCGDDEMTPANIVGMAYVKGLDVIALTDHNSCKNCQALMTCAQEYGIVAIPGIEITTIEEVHVVCLFSSIEKTMEFDAYVYGKLLPVRNKEHIFGRQIICDHEDVEIGIEPLLLINSVNISFDILWELVNQYGGVMIPAHINKNSNSLLFNLGFVPPDSKFRVVEMVREETEKELLEQNPYLKQCNIIYNSDAHYLQDIKEPLDYIEVEERSIKGILEALVKR